MHDKASLLGRSCYYSGILTINFKKKGIWVFLMFIKVKRFKGPTIVPHTTTWQRKCADLYFCPTACVKSTKNSHFDLRFNVFYHPLVISQNVSQDFRLWWPGVSLWSNANLSKYFLSFTNLLVCFISAWTNCPDFPCFNPHPHNLLLNFLWLCNYLYWLFCTYCLCGFWGPLCPNLPYTLIIILLKLSHFQTISVYTCYCTSY